MPSTRVVIAAALAGCLPLVAAQAAASETGVGLGAVFRLPFNGGLEPAKASAPRFGLGMSMRQDSIAGVRRFDRRSMQLDLASIPFNGRRLDFHEIRFMGRNLFQTTTVFRADGSGEERASASSKTLIYGILGLVVVGGMVVALTSDSGPGTPDVCIAIFPPPPGCP